jgi:hypothetical protein
MTDSIQYLQIDVLRRSCKIFYFMARGLWLQQTRSHLESGTQVVTEEGPSVSWGKLGYEELEKYAQEVSIVVCKIHGYQERHKVYPNLCGSNA